MFLVGPKTKNTFLHFDTAALERPNLPPRARSASGRLRCATSEVAVAAPFVVVSPPPLLVSNMGKADDDGEQSTAAGSSELCAASEGGRESCREHHLCTCTQQRCNFFFGKKGCVQGLACQWCHHEAHAGRRCTQKQQTRRLIADAVVAMHARV
mmetsp:Transcript_3978/g.14816  ORF Transcript_3978/g.14816 Transcript_3978/m.14816 type:complete len:154 (-) Transcript_3978:359-820(-)